MGANEAYGLGSRTGNALREQKPSDLFAHVALMEEADAIDKNFTFGTLLDSTVADVTKYVEELLGKAIS